MDELCTESTCRQGCLLEAQADAAVVVSEGGATRGNETNNKAQYPDPGSAVAG